MTNRDAKYEIVLKSRSDEATYDNKPHSVEGFETLSFTTSNGNTYTVEGVSARVSGTDADTYTNEIKGAAVVKDASGNVVTDQFSITPQQGTLTIHKRAISFASASDSKPYDGTALTNGEVTVGGAGFAEGDGAEFSVTGTQTLVGFSPNSFTYQLTGNAKPGNYNVSTSTGTLTVTNRDAKYQANVTAKSGGGVYKGTAYMVSGLVGEIDTGIAAVGTAVPIVVDGKTFYVKGLTASKTGTDVLDSGLVDISGTPVVLDAAGNDVSGQFNIKPLAGRLDITPAELTIKADNGGKTYGEKDGELTATVSGLHGTDVFDGEYDVVRTGDDTPGTYDITVENVRFDNPNYTVSTEKGIYVVAAADTVSIIVSSPSKPYDGTPLTPEPPTFVGLQQGDTVEYVFSGSQTNAGSSEGTVTGVVIRNAAGDDVTSRYKGVNVIPGTLTITPKAVTIVVNSASKLAGAADPAFTGTVTGLVNPGDLGNVTYSRSNATVNEVGTYEGVLVANYTTNDNYAVEVVPGTFSITAVPVVPTNPTTPPTPQEPTPLNPLTPGVLPEGDPIAPIANALEQAIAPIATPLAGPTEQTIAEGDTPLAGYDVVQCWVHYYIIIGIIITMLYGAGVLVRRINFTRKLKGWEKDVLGEDETAAAPVAPATTEGKAV